jgi:hypothetical protein
MRNAYKVSVRIPNGTLSATSATLWQYEVLFIVFVAVSVVEVKVA